MLCLAFALLLHSLFCSTVTGGGNSGYSSNSPKTYKVVSIVSPPFLNAPDKNGKYSGYIIDLLEGFKLDGDFDYTIQLQPDGIYGDYYANKTTTGLIHTVQTGIADIAAAALTVTQNRSQAVDFTSLIFGSGVRVAVNSNFNNKSVEYYLLGTTTLINFFNKSKAANIGGIWNDVKDRLADRSFDVNQTAKIVALVQRLINGDNVALVGETPALNIVIRGHEDKVFLLPGSFYESFYALAVKLGSSLRRFLTLKILKLAENGYLVNLLDGYFGNPCSGSSNTGTSNVITG